MEMQLAYASSSETIYHNRMNVFFVEQDELTENREQGP